MLTEASGDRQTTVDILSFDGSFVTVQKLDGKQSRIAIEKLSETDRACLKSQFKDKELGAR